MKVTRYREDSWMVPGHERAARRLAKNNGVVQAAFTDLDCGLDAEDAEEYMRGVIESLMAHSIVKEWTNSEDAEKRDQFEQRLFIAMLQLATTCVEADRERRE